MNKKPLEGIKVLDFTQALAGVYCAMNLGDFGADVIKIERATYGDQSREWGPFVNNFSAYFATYNRNKRSVALDLYQAEAKEMILDMVKDCDLVLENFKAGTMEKLGLGYDVLKEVNPRLIYGSISGFGLQGPLKSEACYDIIAAARSGMLDRTGPRGGIPVKCGFSVGDNWSGLNLFFGVSMALVQRQATGHGCRLDLAMLDGLFYTLEQPVLEYAYRGAVTPKNGNADTEIAPNSIFKTTDGYIALGIFSEKQWGIFCGLMGMDALKDDPRFADNSARLENLEALTEEISARTATQSKYDLEKLLNDNGVAASGVNTIRDLVEKDEQVRARDMIVPVDHPIIGPMSMMGIPIKFSDTPGDVNMRPAPFIGQHSREVMTQMGYSQEKMDQLFTSGAAYEDPTYL